jgi:hypothetical protein
MRRPLPVAPPAPPLLSPEEKQYRHLNTKADILCNLARGYRAQGDSELADANRAEARTAARPGQGRHPPLRRARDRSREAGPPPLADRRPPHRVQPLTRERTMLTGKDPEGLRKATNFADFVRMLEHGDLHNELGDMLREIAGAMENHACRERRKGEGEALPLDRLPPGEGHLRDRGRSEGDFAEDQARPDRRLGHAGELLQPAGSAPARHVPRTGARCRRRRHRRSRPSDHPSSPSLTGPAGLVWRLPALHKEEATMDEVKGPTEAGALADILKNNFTPEMKTIGKVAGRDVQACWHPRAWPSPACRSCWTRQAAAGPPQGHDPGPGPRQLHRDRQPLQGWRQRAVRLGDLNPIAASLTAVFNYNRQGGDRITDQDGKASPGMAITARSMPSRSPTSGRPGIG